jgi:hypothetical protein
MGWRCIPVSLYCANFKNASLPSPWEMCITKTVDGFFPYHTSRGVIFRVNMLVSCLSMSAVDLRLTFEFVVPADLNSNRISIPFLCMFS